MPTHPPRGSYGRLIMQAYEYWFGRDFRGVRQKVDRVLREVARRYHGELEADTDADVFPMVRVRRPRALLSLKVQPTYQGQDGFQSVLTVRSRRHDGRDNPFPVLHCLSRDLAERDLGAPWMETLNAGVATFDARFVCREIPGGGAAGLLTPRLRQHLLTLYFAGGRQGAPNLWFESQANFVRFKQAVQPAALTPDGLRRLFTRGYATFLLVEGRVLQRVRPLPGRILVRRRQQATCRVCGEVVMARAVGCVACETVHHQECWDYSGTCATYACGSDQARPVLELGG